MSAQPSPSIRYVVFHSPGPTWKKGVDFRDQPGVGEHINHYRKLHEAGRLHYGGPFLDNSGGMMIPVAGETKESIEMFSAEDPAVKSGLLIFTVKPWIIGMEKDN